MDCRGKILSNDYRDLIVDYVISPDSANGFPQDICYHKVDDDLGIVYINKSSLPAINLSQAGYSFIPKCYGLMQLEAGNPVVNSLNTLSLDEAGILSVQQPPLSLSGQGTIIAFIDTGIRYQDEVFRDFAGRSRILAIWDQTIQEKEPPQGFEYGTEYTKDDIDNALSSETPLEIVPSTDTVGHGSVMAAVALGSRISDSRGTFVGAAPQSEIVVVKLKEIKPYLREYYSVPEGVACYSETDIIQAIQYVQQFVSPLSRPVVICLGIGTSLGDHSGSGALGTYIEMLSRMKSRVFVIGGGNEGNASHHYRGEISLEEGYKDVELRVGSGEKGFVLDLWGQAPYFFGVTIRSPSGESIQWENPRVALPQEFTFVFEQTRIILDSLLVEQTSGAELIRFRFIQPSQGVWTIRVNAETNTSENIQNSVFDMWLPITQFLISDTFFLEASPYTTITEPAYTYSAVTTATYQEAGRGVSIFSGRGYAVIGFVKPDISAPGTNVSTPYGVRSGSSVAAAITAGGCALLMEWAVVRKNDILVSSLNIKNYLIRGATRQSYISYPDRAYGYGMLNISGVFKFIAGI